MAAGDEIAANAAAIAAMFAAITIPAPERMIQKLALFTRPGQCITVCLRIPERPFACFADPLQGGCERPQQPGVGSLAAGQGSFNLCPVLQSCPRSRAGAIDSYCVGPPTTDAVSMFELSPKFGFGGDEPDCALGQLHQGLQRKGSTRIQAGRIKAKASC